MTRLLCGSLFFLASLAAVPGAVGQTFPEEVDLAEFVEEVAQLWVAGDVPALVELLPVNDPMLLDAGAGMGSANRRHAAAALRALFAGHESIGIRTVDAAAAGTEPARGFGELVWTFRARGAPGEQSRSVYFAVLRDGPSWRITELRLLP